MNIKEWWRSSSRSHPLSPPWFWETTAILAAAGAPLCVLLVPRAEGGFHVAWAGGAVVLAAVGAGVPRYLSATKEQRAEADARESRQELDTAAEEKKQAVYLERNALSRKFVNVFSAFDLIVSRKATAGIDRFATDLMNQLVELLDDGGGMDVRACYYTQGMMEEDPDFENGMPEALALEASSNGAANARRDFSTGDELGEFLIGKMRSGQALKVIDIDLGGEGIPEPVLNDPRYRSEPRPYTGFYSVPIFDPTRERKDRLVGMLTVDFEGRGRPTESDTKLIESHKDILSTAVVAAGRISRAAVSRRIVRMEGRK